MGKSYALHLNGRRHSLDAHYHLLW